MKRLFAVMALPIAVVSSVASASSNVPASANITTRWPVRTIAADGKRVAFVAQMRCTPQSCAGPVCATVRVWRPARRRAARLEGTCPNDFVPYVSSVALAGTRAAWLQAYSGMSTKETVVMSATPSAAKPVQIAYAAGATYGGYGDSALPPVGDGRLLVFTIETRCRATGQGEDGPPCPPGRKDHDVIRATVWRMPGRDRCPGTYPIVRRCARVAQATSELTALAADAGRMVVRTSDGVSLITPTGHHLRDFPVTKVAAAALSVNRLALRVPGAIEIYDTVSGERVGRVPAAGQARLEDLDHGILVTAVKRTVKLKRLADGRVATINTRGVPHAQLEASGLFVGGGRQITFTPMTALWDG